MVMAIVELTAGKISDAELQSLTMARGLAGDLGVPLQVGLFSPAAWNENQTQEALAVLAAYGVAKVFRVRHERLTGYAPDAWAQSLCQLLQELAPQVVLAPATDHGNEVMARAAARLDLPFAAQCTRIAAGDPFIVTRLRWGGSLLEEAVLKGSPRLMTAALHAMSAAEAPEATEPQTQDFTPELSESDFILQAVLEPAKSEGVSLAEARLVIGGGRGVGGADEFAVLDELASMLGGAVGGSRVVTNNGWRPHSDQIGQTGTRISPDLYIACGISGATQHMVGCMGAKCILAINTDREAPIISKADYAVIGDLHEVLGALKEAVRLRQSG